MGINSKRSGFGPVYLAAAVIAALLIATRLLPLGRWLEGFDHYISGLGVSGFFLFVSVYALGTILFLPGSVLTIGAGLVYGLGAGTLAVTLGANLGAAAAFLLARHAARGRIAALAAANPRFKLMDAAIARQGWKVVLLLRLSPLVPFNLINYFYGLTSIRFWPYAINSFLGMLPGTVLYVYIGAAGRAGLRGAAAGGVSASRLKTVLFVVGLLATLAVSWVLARQAKRILAENPPEKKP